MFVNKIRESGGMSFGLALVGLMALSSLSALKVEAADNSAAINAQLLYSVDQMKEELRDLRGQVDELTYRLKQAEDQQKTRYIDLDSRLQKLSGGGSDGTSDSKRSDDARPGNATPSDASVGAVPPPLAESGTIRETVDPQATTEAGEVLADSNQVASPEARKAYDDAYALIKQRQYEPAVDALHAFVKDHPDSDLTANAYYWLGEVYLVLPRLELAKQSFLLVVGKFPEHRKAPDAMYKLGVTTHRLGENDAARKVLNEVQARYPDTTAARLAGDYKKQL
ncbi:tol-pal system protein YbgF [Allohahella marinimesophila]|uniref:Cell division coordinator CpoB n=1 Tax=Allohahella marinimesophila TaxID=1054972 RepID=A0ABP7NQA6_9GAMM